MCQMIVETDIVSPTEKYLYSDAFFEAGVLKKENKKFIIEKKNTAHYHGILNKLVRYPVIGIFAAISKMALSIIHIVGHLFAALATCKKGHLFHAMKGGCEFIRSTIEAIPIFGRIFTCLYSFKPGSGKDYYHSFGGHMYEVNHSYWWIMKIYHPKNPDRIDINKGLWRDSHKPSIYIKA